MDMQSLNPSVGESEVTIPVEKFQFDCLYQKVNKDQQQIKSFALLLSSILTITGHLAHTQPQHPFHPH